MPCQAVNRPGGLWDGSSSPVFLLCCPVRNSAIRLTAGLTRVNSTSLRSIVCSGGAPCHAQLVPLFSPCWSALLCRFKFPLSRRPQRNLLCSAKTAVRRTGFRPSALLMLRWSGQAASEARTLSPLTEASTGKRMLSLVLKTFNSAMFRA
jgi:hypothetical protein